MRASAIREEALVEADRIHVGRDIQQLGTAGLHVAGPVQGTLRTFGKIDPQILDAILVPAGVHDFLLYSYAPHGVRASAIRENCISTDLALCQAVGKLPTAQHGGLPNSQCFT